MYNNPFMYHTIARPSFISRLLGRNGTLGLARSFNFGNILSNTQKSLGIVNQVIPIVKEVKPMVNNAKSIFKIANLLNDNTDKQTTIKPSNQIPPSNANKPVFYI